MSDEHGSVFQPINQSDMIARIESFDHDEVDARAREFDWAEYREKLSVDGTLSEGEQKHLEIVEALFNDRLNKLENSREALLTILGVQS